MNKTDIIELIGQQTSTKKEAETLVTAVFTSIQDALKKGDRVQISGFGTFSVKERKARVGRNPKTGASVNIPAKTVARFKASNELL